MSFKATFRTESSSVRYTVQGWKLASAIDGGYHDELQIHILADAASRCCALPR